MFAPLHTSASHGTSAHDKVRSTSTSQASASTCTQCSPSNRTRHIVVCIDGTGDRFRQSTNVANLFAMVDHNSASPEQLVYYEGSVGTRPKLLHALEGKTFSDRVDMAIGRDVVQHIIDAYSWLGHTYREGDKIFLFGSSRGAYQVRVLAAMIYEVGLAKTPTDDQIGMAYDYYHDTACCSNPDARQSAIEFKNTYSWKQLKRVHFVGVWDTISSVGLARKDVLLSSSAMHACHFRHALALDELRVKFMPEYFVQINPQTYGSRYRHASTNKGQGSDDGSGNSLADGREGIIKEVWFAGCHSDVGGAKKPGCSYQAGNISLMWMRREATEQGLVLLPTDIVWVPEDIDYGTSDSMTTASGYFELFPIKHQARYSGTGEYTSSPHLLQPRRIIPGQKLHASILYADTYRPKAILSDGFDIPTTRAEPENIGLDGTVWETGFFDRSAAKELLDHLADHQGIAPVYLHRLLFMLRFQEGKEYVRGVDGWLSRFIQNKNLVVRLVALVIYHEAAYGVETGEGISEPTLTGFDDSIFGGVKEFVEGVLEKHKHQDWPIVVPLLRPLAKHPILCKRILTGKALENLFESLDRMLIGSEGNLGREMDGLNSLIQCDHTQGILITKLMEPFPDPSHVRARLAMILQVVEPRLLAAGLRLVLIFARIVGAQKAKKTTGREQGPREATRAAIAGKQKEISEFWLEVQPKVWSWAGSDNGSIGRLAIEVLFTLSVDRAPGLTFSLGLLPKSAPKAPSRSLYLVNWFLELHGLPKSALLQLCYLGSQIRANVASFLTSIVRPTWEYSAEGPGQSLEHADRILGELFGHGAMSLSQRQKKRIAELQKAVESDNSQERAAGTVTLLKLCETQSIRIHLLETGLLDVFIDQLRFKDRALVAAYALATCLGRDDMKHFVLSKEYLPKYIVRMLQYDYFDDAVGSVEGFQIFRDLMEHVPLRKDITERYDITRILDTKLRKGKRKQVRISLICLDIFLWCDPDGPWARELVERCLRDLKNPKWKVQKEGMMALSALAQTARGTEAIKGSISEIIGLLLPKPNTDGMVFKPSLSSFMMGPAYTLSILTRNETLRECTQRSDKYENLKSFYLMGTLISEKDTWVWRVYTPNRSDVTNVLDNLIQHVDQGLSDGAFVLRGEVVLPRIVHWDRVVVLFGNLTTRLIISLISVPRHLVAGLIALPVFCGLMVTAPVVGLLRWIKRLLSKPGKYYSSDDLPRH